MNRKLLVVPSIVAAAALGLSGCAANAASGSASTDAKSTISVVASTDVYGDIAAQVGGKLITVTSIIDDPDKDPHEYEADAQNQLSISKAKLVIENGAGYDDFVGTMLSAAKNKAPVLNAADISGYNQKPATGDFNEHLWYDFPTVTKVTKKIVSALSKIDSADADTFVKNGAAFTAKLAALESTESDLKAKYAGEGVAITEPVPLYMLNAIGLDNKTPSAFSEAIEEDTDVAPSVLNDTLKLYSSGAIKLLAYNEQTTGPQTEAVLNAAKTNNVAVVPVTETLPAGKSYLSWMTGNLDAISTALSK